MIPLPELITRKQFLEHQKLIEESSKELFEIAFTCPEVPLNEIFDAIILAFHQKGASCDVMTYYDGEWRFLGTK